MRKFLFFIASFLMLASCSSNGNKQAVSDSVNTDSVTNIKSDIWYWVNYDDGFGNSTDAKFLQTDGVALYSDPTVEKMECAVYISVDPNIGKAVLTFNNGQNNLKGLGDMTLQIKDSDGKIHTAPFHNSEDGTCFTVGDNDIILELLKTEKPLSFRIEQQSYAGTVLITFQFPNDQHFNELLQQVPHRDKSFYNIN